MKKVKQNIISTNDVITEDLPKSSKNQFINYINRKRQEQERKTALDSSQEYIDFVQDTTFNLKQSFESTNGISGLDPDNNKVVQRLKKNIVCIDSKFRDKSVYPNSNNFKAFLGRSFKNVVKIRVASTQIPNVEEAIKNTPPERQNNIISWQNEDEYSQGIFNNCPFTYDFNSKKFTINVVNHGLIVGETINIYYFDCSVSILSVNGYIESYILDENNIQFDYSYYTNSSGQISLDFGVPIYTVEITPGSYNAIKIGEELQRQMNSVKRVINGKYHYFLLDVNTKTNIFNFKNFDVNKLENNSISTTAGSNLITVNASLHGIQENEEFLIQDITNLGGINSSFLNGLFIAKNVSLDSFQYEVGSNASITTTGGGNNVIIGKYIPFRFLFDSSNTLLQFNIGFPDEDSAESINQTNPIETFKIPIENIYTNSPSGYTTIETIEPHYLDSAKIIRISNINTNTNPVYLDTTTPHNILKETVITISNTTTIPNINKQVLVIPLTTSRLKVVDNNLVITSNTTDYTKAYFFAYNDLVDIINLDGYSNNNPEFIYGKNIPVFNVISDKIFTFKGVFDYVNYSTVKNAFIATSKLKITTGNGVNRFNNLTQLYNNKTTENRNGGIPVFNPSILNPSNNEYYEDYYLLNSELTYTDNNSIIPANKYKTNCIAVENVSTLSNSVRNITAITNPNPGKIIQIQMNSDYFYVPGETITITGTTSLNGQWTIYKTLPSGSPPNPPYDIYSVRFIQIETTITDISFSSATVQPSFHKDNTIRIMYYNHLLDTNDNINILYQYPPNDLLLLNKNHLIEYISPNSFLISLTHSTLFYNKILSIINDNLIELSNISDNTVNIKPIGAQKYYNELEIKDITGEVKLGQNVPLRIDDIQLPESLVWEDLATNDTGKDLYLLGSEYYPLILYADFISSPDNFNFYGFDYKSLIKFYVSNDYGSTFENKSYFNISKLSTNDTIYITDGNGVLTDNTEYSITKLSNYTFSIQYNHTSSIPDTQIQFKVSNDTNIVIDGLLVENNNINIIQRNILAIIDLSIYAGSNNFPNNVKAIVLDAPTRVLRVEEIIISGTNALNGSHSVYTTYTQYYLEALGISGNTNVFYDPSQVIYIISSISDISFSGTPTFSVNYCNTNTLRIICPITTPDINKISIGNNSDAMILYKQSFTNATIPYDANVIYKYYINTGIITKQIISSLSDVFDRNSMYIASSSNGQYILLATVLNSIDTDYRLLLSNDFGNTFIQIYNYYTATITIQTFNCCCISDNGKFITWIVQIGSISPSTIRILNSLDYGSTWITDQNISGFFIPDNNLYKNMVACSGDGKYVLFCAQNAITNDNTIFISNDYGQTYTKTVFPILTGNQMSIHNVTMTSNGKYQIISGGEIIFSEDYGVTWKNYTIDNDLWDGTFGVDLNMSKVVDITTNGKVFYSILTTNTSTFPINNKILSDTLIKWEVNQNDLLEITLEPSDHYWLKNNNVTITDCIEPLLNGSYSIKNKTNNSIEIEPNYLISPIITTYFNGNIKIMTKYI